MGKIILIDKPKGITSFDVCFKMRRLFNTKKIGHTGTLDPNATGLMMILTDNYTKANQFLVSASKEYIATVKLGIKTDSLDIDGEVIESKIEQMPSKEKILEVLNSFIGKQLQTPPMKSAIQVNGKRLYQYLNEGIEVTVKPREIEIFEIELLNIDVDTFTIRTKVSSGTYVRTLVQDILNKLDLIGTLLDLRRTKIDNFKIEDATSLEEALKGNYKEMRYIDVLSNYYPLFEVPNSKDVMCGKTLRFDSNLDEMLCVEGDKVLAIYKKDGNVYKCLRGLV